MDKKPLTEMQAAFLDNLMGEAKGNIRKAMDLAGYAKSTKTSEVVGPLREDITERASMMLAMNTPKAAFGIIDVLQDPSSLGARNAISAAREVLDRSGLIKKEQIEVTSNGGGMFVLPPKAPDENSLA
tara:strand:+ start:3330 stop:3713 length:384 start_codon:yes stop_codon:yes gene_type:complete